MLTEALCAHRWDMQLFQGGKHDLSQGSASAVGDLDKDGLKFSSCKFGFLLLVANFRTMYIFR